MQYFQALQLGQRRIGDSVALLKRYTKGNALPAIALKENKGRGWEPVGEENLVSITEGEYGYIVCLCDSDGNAKAISSWYSKDEAERILASMVSDGISRYEGRLRLPI
jgi:hypothetical protein